MMIIRPGVLFGLLLLAGCDNPAEQTDITRPGHYDRSIELDGEVRSYELHVPASYDGSRAFPLLYDMHPAVINGTIQNMMSDFQALAEEEDFILVQPDGIGGSWNAGEKCCGTAYARKLDDTGLMRQIRRQLITDGLRVDESRTFMDGMSAGGYLSHTVACTDTDFVAGIAGVVASMAWRDVSRCRPTRPVPVLMISGSRDLLSDRKETFDRWRELNQCSGPPRLETSGVFTCEIYENCSGGVETTHCVGDGVGHCWPGTDFSIYSCNQDLDASRYIWNFFERAAG